MKVKNSLIRLLFEAPEEEKEQADQSEMLSDASLDAKVDAILSKSESSYDGSEPNEEDLHYVIATNINNLIENFDNVVDPRTICLNRALNYIRKTKPDLVERVEEVLLTDFDLQTKLDSSADEELNGSVPAAAGAGGDASGGGGV